MVFSGGSNGGGMRVMAFFSIHPVGEGESLTEPVANAVKVIKKSGLEHDVGATGTTLLGEWDEVMDVVQRCHEAVGQDGGRLNSVLKIDWNPTLEQGAIQDKVDRVMEEVEPTLQD